MTKEILLNPSILIDYRVRFFCINMEVVDSFRCKEIILSIDDLESADSLLISVCEECSTLHYKLFLLCVVDDFLYVSFGETIVIQNRSKENPYTSCIYYILIQFSIESFFKKYLVLWINLN